jgi:hypothetical protein
LLLSKLAFCQGALPLGLNGPAATSIDETVQILAPFFHPPSDYSNQFGSYRSPLIFEDGSLVKTPADWRRRREEILRQWHSLMGPWPPVLPAPKFEFLPVVAQTPGLPGGGRALETNAPARMTTNAGETTVPPPRENFARHRIRLEIAPDQTGEGWLLVPEGKGPFPAVLVLYYEPETSIGQGKEPLRDFGLQLARRGFVTLSMGTPGGNAWKPELGSAQCQPLSFHAYVAANCWQALASLPQVDSARIGVVGHSYGGKWALFAGALWDKFAAVAVSDPGIVFDETRPNVNYWEPWYLGLDANGKRPKAGLPTPDNPRTGAYKRMVETGRDLHELHALNQPSGAHAHVGIQRANLCVLRAFLDQDYPTSWEPGGEDFFSPALMEADLMRRALSAEEFRSWFGRFLPKLNTDGYPSLLRPALVTDRSDPKLMHLDGLNLSRAWCMMGIAGRLAADDPSRRVLVASAQAHLRATLPEVTSGHYEGEHWLATFAICALSAEAR